ncbi:hypothetical protein N0V93_003459 [Gnomoniopsis smithogilvyi]|uniref:Uncharacterized protein n=1 Tax=Gnomoniopsis smithogilvyi TaxID=1191159 RepID=A0A9W9CZV9_9PEZI|nr:hypothetical protein N0V93_003459 [Gnomoniopsis smithogilvyi]
MPSSSSSKVSAYHKNSPSASTKRHRSELSTMDNTLAGQGAGNQGFRFKIRKPQNNDSTIFWVKGAEYTGVTANDQLCEEGVMEVGSWSYPADNHRPETEESSHETNIAQNVEPFHGMTLECSYEGQYPSTGTQLEARQLPLTTIPSLHQPNAVVDDKVHDWVVTIPGYRLANPPGAHDNVTTFHRGSSPRECGTSGSSWVLASAASFNVDRDTQRMRPHSSIPSYSRWIEIDQVSEASVHRSA